MVPADGVKLVTIENIPGTGTATMRIMLNFHGADVPEADEEEDDIITTVTILGNYTLSRTDGSSGTPSHIEGALLFGKVVGEVYTPITEISSLES